MKQKLLLAMALLLPLIVGEVQAQKSLPSKHGFEQNRKSANAREVQSATTAKTPSRRSVLRAPSTDVQAPTDVAARGITGASATVSWNGTGDSYNLRYWKILQTEGFESSSQGQLPAGWTALDADGDGYSWYLNDNSSDMNDDNGNPLSFDRMNVESASWLNETGPLNPDNWLISPQVPLKGKLKLWVRGVDPAYADEHFAIYLSTTGKDVADFTTVLIPETVAQGVLTEYTADLSAYAGQVGYIAIRHFNTYDMYKLSVDNITFTDDWVEADGVTSPYTLDGLDDFSIYDVEVQAVTGEQQSSWSTLRFKTSGITIPTNATILYRQNFDDTNDINELGWTFVDNDVDNDGNGRNWTMSINGKYDNREVSPLETNTSFPNSLYSQSYTSNGQSAFNADNWAITPAIKIYESSILSFQLAYGDYTYPDKVGVYVGETANVNEMTEVLPLTSFSRTANLQFNKVTVDLSAFAGKTCYIAFRHQDYDNWIVLIDDVIVYTTAMKYNLTLAEGSDDHGTVAFTVGGNAATQAKKDDEVTLTITPAAGYELESISVTGVTTGNAVEVTDGKFTMPAEDVNVIVTFKLVTYAISLAEGTEDADNWTITPKEGLTGDGTETVTITYSGSKRVKSVTAVKKAAVTYPLLSAATTDDIGKVVCAAGHLHDAKTAVPDGCTAVGILGKVTETGHGLILALKDATSQTWNTINDGWTSVTTYAGTTLKVLPDDAARGTNLTGYSTLGETAVSNWAVAQKGDYEAIFENLGSTKGDSYGKTYDGNVNAYITTGAGGTAIDGNYWSATTEDGEAWAYDFESEYWNIVAMTKSLKVRPVLGF